MENLQKGFCPPCKNEWEGLYPRCKKHGRDYVHLYKNEQKGLCPGGILSYTQSTNELSVDQLRVLVYSRSVLQWVQEDTCHCLHNSVTITIYDYNSLQNYLVVADQGMHKVRLLNGYYLLVIRTHQVHRLVLSCSAGYNVGNGINLYNYMYMGRKDRFKLLKSNVTYWQFTVKLSGSVKCTYAFWYSHCRKNGWQSARQQDQFHNYWLDQVLEL